MVLGLEADGYPKEENPERTIAYSNKKLYSG